jgi:hypothetical protein
MHLYVANSVLFVVSCCFRITILHNSYDRQALVKCLNALLPQTKVRSHFTTPDTVWQPQASTTNATGIHRALELARTKARYQRGNRLNSLRLQHLVIYV